MSSPSLPLPSALPELAPVCCPACGDHLRAHPHEESAPLTFPCGHSACKACAAAVLLCEAPVCPVCLVAVGGAETNIALGVFAEAVLCGKDVAGELVSSAGPSSGVVLGADSASLPVAPSAPPRSKRPMKKPRAHHTLHSTDACPEADAAAANSADPLQALLLGLLETFIAASHSLQTGISKLATVKAGMIAGKEASVFRFSKAVDDAIAVLNSHRAAVIRAANSACDERVKVLDSQADTLAVSVSQLQCAIAIGQAAVGTGAVAAVASAHSCVSALAPLAVPFAGPAVVPVVEVAQSLGSSYAYVSVPDERCWLVPGSAVHVVSGTPQWFVPGKVNEAKLVLKDVDDNAPLWIWEENAVITVTVRSDGGSSGSPVLYPASFVKGPAGALHVKYEASAGVGEVELCVSVFGEAVGGGRFAVPRIPDCSHQCAATGVFVRAFPLQGCELSGLAVSADEKWLVVGSDVACTLSVYSLPKGKLERLLEFGGCYEDFAEPRGLSSLCFAPSGNLLVVDNNFLRLREMTLEGAIVRDFGEGQFDVKRGMGLSSVVVHDDVVAVGFYGGPAPCPGVALFDFSTGEVTARFCCPYGRPLSGCPTVAFSTDGSHVIVSEWSSEYQSKYTVEGVFVKHVCEGSSSAGCNLVHSVTGEIVLGETTNQRVCVFSPDELDLVRQWGSRGTGDGEFENVLALAAAGKHLYVLDGSARVQVFE